MAHAKSPAQLQREINEALRQHAIKKSSDNRAHATKWPRSTQPGAATGFLRRINQLSDEQIDTLDAMMNGRPYSKTVARSLAREGWTFMVDPAWVGKRDVFSLTSEGRQAVLTRKP